jgi:hypothetical protein
MRSFKKKSCTISGEEEKLTVYSAKEFASVGSFLSSAAPRLVVPEVRRETTSKFDSKR